MTREVSVRTLTQGDVIDTGANRETYHVLGNSGRSVAVGRHVHVTNPSEWKRNGVQVENVQTSKLEIRSLTSAPPTTTWSRACMAIRRLL